MHGLQIGALVAKNIGVSIAKFGVVKQRLPENTWIYISLDISGAQTPTFLSRQERDSHPHFPLLTRSTA